MGFKDHVNALGRDFRDVPDSYRTLFLGALALAFALQIAYFSSKSSGTNILFGYLLVMGAALSMLALIHISGAWLAGRKPQ